MDTDKGIKIEIAGQQLWVPELDIKLPQRNNYFTHHARRYRHGMKNKARHNATHHG